MRILKQWKTLPLISYLLIWTGGSLYLRIRFWVAETMSFIYLVRAFFFWLNSGASGFWTSIGFSIFFNYSISFFNFSISAVLFTVLLSPSFLAFLKLSISFAIVFSLLVNCSSWSLNLLICFSNSYIYLLIKVFISVVDVFLSCYNLSFF